MPRLGAKGSNKKTVVGELRRTQVITTYGPGAIVDLPDISVIMAATDYWNSRNSRVLHEANLQKLLGVNCFREPCAHSNEGFNESGTTPDTPAFRFPDWCFCPKCGKLAHYKDFGKSRGKIICEDCKCKTVPSRFVAACINGHLEDFPYNWWVHQPTKMPYDKNHRLKIKFTSESGGLDSIIIECETCGAKRSMEGALNRDALKGHKCRGLRPWVGKRKEKNDQKDCDALLRGIQRDASNLYFPITSSALTIPPWSKRIYQDIEKHREQIDVLINQNNDINMLRLLIQALMNKELADNFYSVDDVIKIIQNENRTAHSTYTKQNLLEDEYKVFMRGNYENPDDMHFKLKKTNIDSFFGGLIDNIFAVKRLREILALKGFRRIKPEGPETNASEDEQRDFIGYRQNDCTPLSDEKLDWLPAVELLGEGIFISFNEERLEAWEKSQEKYYANLKKRLAESIIVCDNFSPRYVLLHTLSHLLIRQLTMECGYSGASIKERIYSTYPESNCKMAGILLYTASSDTDGSLGGLVRNAEPDNITPIFKKMLQEASWCSSDPICMDSKGQGFDSLNYAACHACALLPETSCEMRNCLLDRGAVVGSIHDRGRGYFSSLLK